MVEEVLNKPIADLSQDISDKVCHAVYIKYCQEGGLAPNQAVEQVFTSGFLSGVYAGISAIIATTKED